MNRRIFIFKLSLGIFLVSLFPTKLFAKMDIAQMKRRLWEEIKKHPDKVVTNRIRKLEVLPNPDTDQRLYPKGKIPQYLLEIRYDRADGRDRLAQCLFDLPQGKQRIHAWVNDFLTHMRIDHKSSLASLTGKTYNEIVF